VKSLKEHFIKMCSLYHRVWVTHQSGAVKLFHSSSFSILHQRCFLALHEVLQDGPGGMFTTLYSHFEPTASCLQGRRSSTDLPAHLMFGRTLGMMC